MGVGVAMAPLIGFLETIAISKAFGELSTKWDDVHCMDMYIIICYYMYSALTSLKWLIRIFD